MLEDPPVDLDLSSAFTLLSDAVTDEVLQALDGTGLRRAHGYLIQRLLLGPATASEIAEELGVSQQAVSKAAKELVGLGHVAGTTDDADRRRKPLILTDDGLRAVESARLARKGIDDRIRAALGDAAFEHTLRSLVAALDTLGLTDRVQRRAAQPPGRSLD